MCIPGTALSRYINFYTDFAFKKFFGTEANKDLLISFLNCLLEREGEDAIVDLTYMNSEKLGASNSDRRAIYDVYCKTQSEERFIVEMQNALQVNFADRSLYYSSFAIQEQAPKGKTVGWDYYLSPVYVVGVLNFRLDDSGNVVKRVALKDENNHIFSNKLNFIFLEMPNFKKTEKELETFMDKWLFAIKNLYKLQEMPAALTEGIFKKLFNEAEIAAYSNNERYNYEESLKNARDMNGVISSAEIRGREEGRAEGLAEGRAEGLAEGRAEEARTNALKMKAKGYDIADISEITGLSLKEIEKL